MSYKLNFENWESIFALPTCLVDQDLEKVNGTFIKVLLCIIRAKGNISKETIQKKIHAEYAEIDDAISYWTTRGYLTVAEQADVVQNKLPEKKNQIQEPSAYTITSKEIYSKKENNPIVAFLLSSAENIFAHPLNSTEARTLIYILEYIGLPYDVILMVIDYCVRINKPNCRYILKTCQNWYDVGIDTHEKAELHLKNLIHKNEHEQLIKKCFGIYDRNLTAKEKKFIHTWFDEFQFQINVIKLAYERTIDNIGKTSFPYINKILSDWHSKGIKTAQDAANEGNSKKTDAINVQNTSYDLDMFDVMGYHIPDVK